MYHIFFIDLSVNGHLGRLCVLATGNTAAGNVEVHVTFWITVLPGYMPRSGMVDCMVLLFLFFKELWHCSLLCLFQFTFPRAVQGGFLFSTLFPSLVSCRLFNDGHLIPWRRAWQSTPVLLPGDSHGQRSLEGYSPRGGKESNTTERLST